MNLIYQRTHLIFVDLCVLISCRIDNHNEKEEEQKLIECYGFSELFVVSDIMLTVCVIVNILPNERTNERERESKSRAGVRIRKRIDIIVADIFHSFDFYFIFVCFLSVLVVMVVVVACDVFILSFHLIRFLSVFILYFNECHCICLYRCHSFILKRIRYDNNHLFEACLAAYLTLWARIDFIGGVCVCICLLACKILSPQNIYTVQRLCQILPYLLPSTSFTI